MKNNILKKINELFDSEELKSEFEIPYLKGDLDKDKIIKWDKMNIDLETNTTEVIIKKLSFRYPILNYFTKKVIKSDYANSIYAFFAQGETASDGEIYYAQIAYSFSDGFYFVSAILKNLKENDIKKWVNKTFYYNNIDDVYNLTSIFFDTCINLNIMKPHQKSALEGN